MSTGGPAGPVGPGVTAGSSRLRLSRPWVTGLASMTLGVAGALLARAYLEARTAELEARFARPEQAMVQVVVPVRALQPGEVLTMEDLAVRAVPERFADTHSVTDRSVDAALGQRVNFAVDAGRPLLWAHLQSTGSPVFSRRLATGWRAMTVRVDEVNAISGFLQPADRIDLLLTAGAGATQRTLPLIDNLPVIATGVQTGPPADDSQSHRTFTTITVEVSPQDARRITLAQQIGRLTAVLRNPEDREPVDSQSLTVADLLGTAAVPPARAKPAATKAGVPDTGPPDRSPPIQYIIGGV